MRGILLLSDSISVERNCGSYDRGKTKIYTGKTRANSTEFGLQYTIFTSHSQCIYFPNILVILYENLTVRFLQEELSEALCIPHNFKTKGFNYEIYAQPFFIKILHRKYSQTLRKYFEQVEKKKNRLNGRIRYVPFLQ